MDTFLTLIGVLIAAAALYIQWQSQRQKQVPPDNNGPKDD